MDVLVTYFDPFDGKDINNSEVVAKKLNTIFNDDNVTLHLCKLRTVFDKAFDQVQDCISGLDNKPSMIISLGEAGCFGVKIETRAKNYDRSSSPDNDGINRYGTEIYPNETKTIGVSLPVEKAFCALSENQRKRVFISHSAGSFVCNNTLYHLLRNLEIPTTFLHVSERKCTRDESDITTMAQTIGDMISSMSRLDLTGPSQPSNKTEVKEILRSDLTSCERMFYNILKNEY